MEEKTIYSIAKIEIENIIPIYLNLVKKTNNFENVLEEHIKTEQEKIIIINGIGSNLDFNQASVKEVVDEWQRRKALKFNIEESITSGVYYKLRKVIEIYYDELFELSNEFKEFSKDLIFTHPYYLPLYQHICNIPSKQKVKQIFGSVSDNKISKPSSEKISDYMNSYVSNTKIVKENVLTKVNVTLEGIVRDLVGRVVLENIVANALKMQGLSYLRENEYDALQGVVYNFRADFVLPNIESPKVFIEVRKSSSRHASLYAKDKMFSAINWKGQNKEMLAVLVTDGEWTEATLNIMANVFDYVVPISYSEELAKIIKAYLDGDKSRLKWIIDFKISKNIQ